MALRLRAASATDVGNIRANNQDDLLILPDTLFVVADGMGGHASGEVASKEVVDTLRETYADNRTVDGFRDAIRWANRAVWRRGVDEPVHAGMGTTITAVAVVEDESLAVANVGDSRTYLLRDGALTQLTADHSFVQEAVRTGQLTREQAESHPRRSQLTRAMGIGDDVDVDIDVLVPRSGDRLLLCSDGLWDELPDDVISSILRRVADGEAASAELVRQAKEAGGRDNVTVLVVDVEDADDEGRGLAASTDLGDAPTTATPAIQVATVDDGPGATEGLPPTAGEPPLLPQGAERTGPSARLVTWRVVLFVAALLGVLVVAVLLVRGGSDAWKVRLDGEELVIAKGSAVVERTGLTSAQLDPIDLTRAQRGFAAENRADAQRVVDGMAARVAARRFDTVPSIVTTPATTVTASTVTTLATNTVPIGP